ncbi:MAG: M6 family metalloprotease domain-containing protein [Bacteroidota bacterium]
MNKVLVCFLLLISLNLVAAPYNGQIKKFNQPDGSTVELRLFGTEYYMRAESLDGYTLIRDVNTHWICYAKLSADGSTLISSGIIYKGISGKVKIQSDSTDLLKHLDVSGKSREKAIRKNRTRTGLSPEPGNASKTAFHPVSGNIKGICIVVDFSDEPANVPIGEFVSFCDSMNYSHYGNNGSLRKFYYDISGGLLDYENVVYGYFRAPLTFADYEQMPYAQGAQQILGLALHWIDSIGFDFSTLSLNPDNSIMAINLMYTGDAQNWAQGMWWHQGYYGNFSADGVHSGDYNCSPANDPLTIATVCHENGHMIGKWPDTYKYNNNTGPDGIGAFDLMCWYGSSTNPVPPNPHFRSNAGWGKVVDVTFTNGLNIDTANSLTCYKYRNLNDTNEFFLLENRAQSGRSFMIEDQGLTIWHIDRNGDNQTMHHEVYLVHANNDITDHSAACFKAGFNNEYSISTTPNSLQFNGDPSGLRVWDIGSVNNIMNYKLGAGVAAPSFFLSYINVSGDNNGNGFLEPGESGDLNVKVSNYGQLSSAAVTMTCTAIGSTAGYVTINNPVLVGGVIGLSQYVMEIHNISLDPATPVGTVLEFKFMVSDGTYANYISKKIVVGEQIFMTNTNVTTCSAVFYDAGGAFGNYANNTTYFIRFYAAASNHPVRIEFQSFDLEDEPSCAYDYLNIYDGPSMSYPLIGTFCGTNSPGTVTSTHPSGALCLQFHSDEGVTGEGWKAIVTCLGGVGIDETSNRKMIEVAPNPSVGIFNLSINSETDVELIVSDVSGRQVFKRTAQIHGNYTLDLTNQEAGVYFLQVTSRTLVATEKLLINK